MTAIDATPDQKMPTRGLRSGLALLAVVLFFTNLDSYAFAISLGPAPSRFAMAFMAAAALLVMLEPARPLVVLRSPLGLWTFSFFFLTTFWAFGMRTRPELIQELFDRYRSIGCLFAFMVIFDEPRARRIAVIAVAAAVVLASFVNVAEALSLITFNDLPEQRTPGRAGGLYFNANNAALAIVMGLAVVVEAIPRALRAPLLLVAAFGAAATFSRSAMICMAIVFLWMVWRRSLGTGYTALAILCALALAFYGVEYLRAHDLLNENTLARIQLAKGDSGRVALIEKGWALFVKSPWLGNGFGSTISWDEPLRAHNMYVTYAADHGVLGLFLFPALAVALVVSSRGAMGVALVLLAAGFFTHSAVDDRYSLLIIALAAIPAPLPRAAPVADSSPGEESAVEV